jgi:hypothetical protein
MAQPHRKFSWYTLKKAYWFLFPLIGLGIWLITAWMTDWVLSNSFLSTNQLQTNLYPTTQLAQILMVTSIHVKIDRTSNIAEVNLTTTNSTLKRLEFKFPFTEISTLETALAKELNTTSHSIQPLIHYRVE